MANGSLVFGALATDIVSLGTGASMQNLDPFTYIALVYPTSLVTQKCIFTKGTAQKNFRLSGTTGDVQLLVPRATTSASTTTSSTPLATINTWYLIAATFDSTAATGLLIRIYSCALGGTLAECTYAVTPIDGVGSVTADAGNAGRIGNNAATSAAFPGRIAMFAQFGAALSLADLQSWQLRPRAIVGSNTAKAFYRFGNEGTGTQQDYSGNANSGTVTGATQGDGPPFYQGGGYRQSSPSGLFLSVA